jgi:hypothetical protein
MPAMASITTLVISKEEQDHGCLSAKDLQTCLEALHRDGIVILENAISEVSHHKAPFTSMFGREYSINDDHEIIPALS